MTSTRGASMAMACAALAAWHGFATGSARADDAPACPPSWVPALTGTPPPTGLDIGFRVYTSLARVEAGSSVVYLGGSMVTETSASQAIVQRVEGPFGATNGAGGVEIDTVGALPTGYVADFAEHNDGTGLALYAAGRLVDARTGEYFGLARWDGDTWTILPSKLGAEPWGDILAIASFDDGAGPALYAGGRFKSIDGIAAINVARWRNGAWEALGDGVPGQVFAVHVHDDGTSPAIYVGADPYGLPIDTTVAVLRWDGIAWSALDERTSDAALTDASVFALATHDDGTGPALYAGRYGARGDDAVWRWDGVAWTPVGGGIYGNVLSLVSHDDGNGPALYAGGALILPRGPGPAPKGIVRWDGMAWSPLGYGVATFPPPSFLYGVVTMSSIEPAAGDGADSRNGGRALVVAGEFSGVLDAPDVVVAAKNAAIWGDGGVPVAIDGPSDVVAVAGRTVQFHASFFAKPTMGRVNFQWRKDGVDLIDGRRGGSEIAGATTPTLTIIGVGSGDVGLYDLVATNDCGEATSPEGSLALGCDNDVDGNGMIDGNDLGAILAAWGSSSTSADVDGNGTVDAGDLATLFASWGCGVDLRQ